MKKYGREIVGLNADVEEAIECEELLRIEQERYERENGVKKINKCETEVSYRAINATSSASLLRVYVLKIKEGSR